VNLLAAATKAANEAAGGTAGTLIAVALLLLVVAMGLFFLEVIFPSMGLITLAGLGCVAGALALAFQAGRLFGFVFVGVTVVSLPLTVILAFRVLKRSGAVLDATTGPPATSSAEPEGGVSAGERGVAVTVLRPSGKAMLGGRRLSVVTTGQMVEPDEQVEVVRVEGAKVIVKPVREG